jgi:hypothetical protein
MSKTTKNYTILKKVVVLLGLVEGQYFSPIMPRLGQAFEIVFGL